MAGQDCRAIETFNRAHRLGVVLDSSAGFWMFNRNCRAPDVSFVSMGRLAALGFKPNETRFFPGAPDLAVEVLSENNTRAEIGSRLKDFFVSGTQLAWIIDPDQQRVETCHSLVARALATRNGVAVLGSLRIIILAKQRGFIASAKPALEKLRGAGAWGSDELIDRALALAGET